MRQRGFNLMELLVVMLIAGILAAFGLPEIGDMIANGAIRSASSEFYSSLLAARSEAIKRRDSATIAPVGATWNTGWTVKVGGNTFQTADALRSDVSSLPATVTPIVYGYNGRVTAGTQTVVFYLAGSTRVAARCVSIDTNGLPRVRVDSNKVATDGCN